MNRHVRKIAVAGTHSTGKTTFLTQLRTELEAKEIRVAYVHPSAVRARELGFPILQDQNIETATWLVAETIRMEAEASVASDIILVDRPVPDAIGYLLAALRVTGRKLDQRRLDALRAVCAAWIAEYDLIFVTKINPDIPLGDGRDTNHEFRIAAGQAIAELLAEMAPRAI